MENMTEELEIKESYVEEVQDIIGQAPSWVVRRGMFVIALVILLILTGAWFIQYPDIISAPVKISSFNPPIQLVAQANGRITEFYSKDGDWVEENKIIAVIDNPANTNDMLNLKTAVNILDIALDIKKALAVISLSKNMLVGELQPEYAVLVQAIENYVFFNRNSYYADKLADIRSQSLNNDKIRINIQKRSSILTNQSRLEKWKDSANEALLRDKVISLAEYNEIKKRYLTQNISNVDNDASLLQNQQQSSEYKQSVADIRQQQTVEEKNIILTIKDASKKIKGLIANWEKNYIFRSPSSGKLTFFEVRKKNQYVNIGSVIFMVVPTTQQYEIIARFPIYRVGKIKVGQEAMIKLQEYPYYEFGMLRAKVISVSNIAFENSYTVKLKLKNGFKTTRNKFIDNRPEIIGNIDIITSDKNILQRIFENAYKMAQ